MSDFQIRSYHPSDLPMLYRICILSSDGGKDGSHLYQDPDLVGHLYVAPYAVLEPDMCFVLTHLRQPCGYVLGTKDSKTFYQRCEEEWFPILRQRYPYPAKSDSSSNARIIRELHRDYRGSERPEYPAHLHIDFLSVARGKGWGRKMINTFLSNLRDLDIPAVELGVDKLNANAIDFYEALGFTRIDEEETSFIYGLKLH